MTSSFLHGSSLKISGQGGHVCVGSGNSGDLSLDMSTPFCFSLSYFCPSIHFASLVWSSAFFPPDC